MSLIVLLSVLLILIVKSGLNSVYLERKYSTNNNTADLSKPLKQTEQLEETEQTEQADMENIKDSRSNTPTTTSDTTRATPATGSDWFNIQVNLQQYTINGGVYLPKHFNFKIEKLENGIKLTNDQDFIEFTFNIYKTNPPYIDTIESTCQKVKWQLFNYRCDNKYYLIFNIPSANLNFSNGNTVLVLKTQSNLPTEIINSINSTLVLAYKTPHNFENFSEIIEYLHKIFKGINIPTYNFVKLTTSCETETQLELANQNTKSFLDQVFKSDYSSYTLYCPNMQILIPTGNETQNINANFILAIGWMGGGGVFPSCNGYEKCTSKTLKKSNYTVVLTGPTQNQEYSVTFPLKLKINSTGQQLEQVEIGFISKNEKLIKNRDIW